MQILKLKLEEQRIRMEGELQKQQICLKLKKQKKLQK